MAKETKGKWTLDGYLLAAALLVLGLIVGAGIGMAFGQPRFISLEEAQKNSIIHTQERICDDRVDELEDKMEDLRDYRERALDAWSYLTEEVKDYREEVVDMNAVVAQSFRDLNASIVDLNFDCNC